MNKFTSLLDEPSVDFEVEAAYWRQKAARAHLAYSDAYWDYELASDMEKHCLVAAALEQQQ